MQQGLLLVDKGPIQFNVYENNSTPKSLKRKEMKGMNEMNEYFYMLFTPAILDLDDGYLVNFVCDCVMRLFN